MSAPAHYTVEVGDIIEIDDDIQLTILEIGEGQVRFGIQTAANAPAGSEPRMSERFEHSIPAQLDS